jgi:hypothetical protein
MAIAGSTDTRLLPDRGAGNLVRWIEPAGDDPRSGGPLQLVGLYRQGCGMHFGVIFQGKSYYRGVDAISLTLPDLEWRNELFERCDPSGQRLVGAQAQLLCSFAGVSRCR